MVVGAAEMTMAYGTVEPVPSGTAGAGLPRVDTVDEASSRQGGGGYSLLMTVVVLSAAAYTGDCHPALSWAARTHTGPRRWNIVERTHTLTNMFVRKVSMEG